MNRMQTAVRIPDPNEPKRTPDGVTEDGQFYFWLGGDMDGTEDSESDTDLFADSETDRADD